MTARGEWLNEARQHRSETHTLHLLLKGVLILMADLAALQAAVDKITASETAAAAELKTLADEVAKLQAGTITQEQVDAITAKVTDVAGALDTAITGAQPAPAPGPNPTPSVASHKHR